MDVCCSAWEISKIEPSRGDSRRACAASSHAVDPQLKALLVPAAAPGGPGGGIPPDEVAPTPVLGGGSVGGDGVGESTWTRATGTYDMVMAIFPFMYP